MYIQQLYTNCLAQAAYYIEDGHEAAIVDPLRDPQPYIDLAHERGAKIRYVLETHFHADFVSGHLDLANRTGAAIVFGAGAQPGYKAYVAADGEMLHLGNAQIEVLHTPGHTVESACYLVHDEAGAPAAVFTGDTLFVGEVGRPDLMSGNLSKEALAAMLYDSLHNKIMTLPDDVTVYPGHGPGSACGRNIGKEATTTIGREKSFNYALRMPDKDTFIAAVTADLPVAPGYFFADATINKTGYEDFDTVMARSLRGLSPQEFAAAHEAGAIVLDTRDAMDFAAGFVNGAVNIGLNGDFAVWAGNLIDPGARILLVAGEGKEQECIARLARIGYDTVAGYLAGGMTAWFAADQPYDKILTFSGAECRDLLDAEDYNLLDVRNRGEVARNRIAGSVHIPLSNLRQAADLLDPNRKWLVYCAAGYRSMIAASFLKARGFHFVASIEGGIREVILQAPELVEMEVE